ncbi:GNAT family N-acetyltransferase [Rhizobium ruizarguesonis]
MSGWKQRAIRCGLARWRRSTGSGQVRVKGFATDRLVVRPLRLDDHPVCVLTGSHSVLPSLQANGSLLTLSQITESAFRTMIQHRTEWAASDKRYLISAFLRDGGHFVGDTMLFDVFRDPYARAEIGTVIASPFQGSGLGSELIAGTVAWGWDELGLEEIKGFVEDGNIPSTVACLRCGFSLTSSVPISRHFEGELRLGWPIVVRRPR